MTPAIDHARTSGIEFKVHEFTVDDPRGDRGHGFGARAAASLGLPQERVFKTLIARVEGGGSTGARGHGGARGGGSRLVVAVVPVAAQLDLKRLADAAGARSAAMAPEREAERATGYLVGGISPLGQRRRLPTFLDRSALGFPTIYVSGGRRGLEIELTPAALQAACAATVGDIARARG